MSNEENYKVKEGCLSVFLTGLKGFVVVTFVVVLIFVALIVLLWLFFWYTNLMLASPLWMTMVLLALPIIVFIGLYLKLLQWIMIKYVETQDTKECRIAR